MRLSDVAAREQLLVFESIAGLFVEFVAGLFSCIADFFARLLCRLFGLLRAFVDTRARALRRPRSRDMLLRAARECEQAEACSERKRSHVRRERSLQSACQRL